jgi:hypothetical protein
MAYLGMRKPLGKKMMGYRKPMGMASLGIKMTGAEPPVEIMTKGLEQSKKQGGLERVRRNGGWSSLGNYGGA